MRLDPDHVDKLRAAIGYGGGSHVDIDVAHLNDSLRRLNLWEGGLLMDCLMRAAQASKLSKEQRVLLALFVHDHGRNEPQEAVHAD